MQAPGFASAGYGVSPATAAALPLADPFAAVSSPGFGSLLPHGFNSPLLGSLGISPLGPWPAGLLSSEPLLNSEPDLATPCTEQVQDATMSVKNAWQR